MCGIAGFLGPGDANILKRMLALLRHRGPDDWGIFAERNVALGMRRLSVIDLKTGHQPQSNEDGDVHIVFNGEIYNYQQLRKELELRGHRFTTKSDTETIVHAYEEWGTACLSRLRGMFAFALWDAKRKMLFLARDRLGKKPLYYSWRDGVFYFASELKALSESGVISKVIDWRALDEFLALQYIPAPRTIFLGAKKLQAAHYALVTKKGMELHRYWDIWYRPLKMSMEAWENEIISRLKESVSMRLISDVPLGAFLSGGIDSSAVVAAMTKVATEDVKTFTIGFEESDYSELSFAREVSEHLGTKHYEKILYPKDVIKNLPKIAWYLDEPFADASAVPTYMVSEFARRYVTVVLSGDGGDENFAGYDRYVIDMLLRGYAKIPQPLRAIGVAAAKKALSFVGMHLLAQRAEKFEALARLPLPERYAELVSFYRNEERERLYKEGRLASLKKAASQKSITACFAKRNAKTQLDKMMYADFNTYLPDDILAKVDRTSMAHSLEARAPLLDHEFVEFAATIPSDLKLRGLETKHVFKRALKPWLPLEILERKKRGFGIPLGPWFKKEVGEFLEQKIAEGRVCAKLFSKDEVFRMLNEHRKGRAAYSYKLWALLELELWSDAFKIEF
ncbi:MAG: asparagine synthase (glutamine-hydrolyzing) [Candidatus Micrarchaeia archaeon]